MDPLSIVSIVSVVGSLVATASKAVLGCWSLKQDFDDVPTAIALLQDECRVIGSVLSYIRDVLMTHTDSLSRRLSTPRNPFSDLVHVALTGSTGIFGLLEGEVRTIYASRSPLEDYGFGQRTRVTWNERSLSNLVERMQNVKGTLNLLLSAIQTESQQEMLRLLMMQAPVVESVRQTISETSPAPSEHETTSIFTGTAGEDCEFSFDDVIVDSKVYREALKSIQRRNKDRIQDMFACARQQSDPPRNISFADNLNDANGVGTTIQRYASGGGNSSDHSEHTETDGLKRSKPLSTLPARWQDGFAKLTKSNKRQKHNSSDSGIPKPARRLSRPRSEDLSAATSSQKVKEGLEATVLRSVEQAPLSIVLIGPAECGKYFLHYRLDVKVDDGPAERSYMYSHDAASKLPVNCRYGQYPVSVRVVPEAAFNNETFLKQSLTGADVLLLCFKSKSRESFESLCRLIAGAGTLCTDHYMLLTGIFRGIDVEPCDLSWQAIADKAPYTKYYRCDATKMDNVKGLFYRAGKLALESRFERVTNAT